MSSEIRNHSYHERIQDIDLISLVQRRLRGRLIEVFKYLNEFTAASARGLFDYDLNDRTRNNGAKLIVKHFNSSVAQHFYPIKITPTWNALPSEVVSSRTANSFKNSLDKHCSENLPNVRVKCMVARVESMSSTLQGCINSRRPVSGWKWNQRSVLLLLLLLLLLTGIITEDWKSANVTAIHKKRKQAGTWKLQPISLTSVVCVGEIKA